MKILNNSVSAKSLFTIFLIAIFLIAVFFNSNKQYYDLRKPNYSQTVTIIEDGLRFINTIAQAALPIIMMDKVGMAQAVYVGIATAISTQGLKRVFEFLTDHGIDCHAIRPNGAGHNMPSGHSSMASSAMFFVTRRYGYWHCLYLVPITILTMCARVELKAHTISATIAGCVLGMLMAHWFSSPAKKV